MLHMRTSAQGRHAMSQKTNKQLSFSTLSLNNNFIATISKDLH